jgi:hypothetical protein
MVNDGHQNNRREALAIDKGTRRTLLLWDAIQADVSAIERAHNMRQHVAAQPVEAFSNNSL